VRFPETSIENLLGFGYTEDEARFLYLGQPHSGISLLATTLRLDKGAAQSLASIEWHPSNSKAILYLVAEERDSNPETLSSLTVFKTGDALRLRPNLMITQDDGRQALDGLGTQFSPFG